MSLVDIVDRQRVPVRSMRRVRRDQAGIDHRRQLLAQLLDRAGQPLAPDALGARDQHLRVGQLAVGQPAKEREIVELLRDLQRRLIPDGAAIGIGLGDQRHHQRLGDQGLYRLGQRVVTLGPQPIAALIGAVELPPQRRVVEAADADRIPAPAVEEGGIERPVAADPLQVARPGLAAAGRHDLAAAQRRLHPDGRHQVGQQRERPARPGIFVERIDEDRQHLAVLVEKRIEIAEVAPPGRDLLDDRPRQQLAEVRGLELTRRQEHGQSPAAQPAEIAGDQQVRLAEARAADQQQAALWLLQEAVDDRAFSGIDEQRLVIGLLQPGCRRGGHPLAA